ncbi:MAG: translation initiation factor IF-6 [Candidatus Aenigmarchaeota archaeon]|nr:translation initiation factor IF-6 [Candidatus Aenigmarchaeota archaeon]
MPHILRTNFRGDPNLGFYATTTDDFCIISNNLMKKNIERMKSILKVDMIKASVAGSEFVGLFAAANKNGIVLPNISKKEEIDIFKKLGFNVYVPDIKQTALGNLILVNDKACLISKDLEKIKNKLEKCFNVPVKTGTIAGLDIVGSAGFVTNQGLLVHRDCTEEEINLLEKFFGLNIGVGTVSFGSPFVGASLVANSNGFVISEQTTGPELQRIDESLGFI